MSDAKDTQKKQIDEQNLDYLAQIIDEKEHGKDFISDEFIKIREESQLALEHQKSDQALEAITKHALSMGVSDVHYDAHEKGCTMRYRIDGNLADVVEYDKKQHKMLVERLKYRSGLKLNITDVPQDGKFRLGDAGDSARIDVRVSSLPTRYGESVVCRILDSSDTLSDFDDLGISWMNRRRVLNTLTKKNGMILVTGPTGSGKTTTLYTFIDKLNAKQKKIITLEDPIEYEIEGVMQSEIDERGGYTYPLGMKAVLRQDPDILMVGEVRELETANIAIQASLTGHLVLSTVHTKSAPETIERLMNIGVEPYNLSASVDIIVAQRLVRKLCPHCKKKIEKPSPAQTGAIADAMKRLGMEGVLKIHGGDFDIYEAGGCNECGNSGYRGRIGVFEVLEFTPAMRELIREKASTHKILDLAYEQDFMTMKEDGILKVLQGITDLDELFRVVE